MEIENRSIMIGIIEDYYCSRMDELVELERFDDSNSIFQEFVVESFEGQKWYFLEDLTNVF
jgi:hypothetical protein